MLRNPPAHARQMPARPLPPEVRELRVLVERRAVELLELDTAKLAKQLWPAARLTGNTATPCGVTMKSHTVVPQMVHGPTSRMLSRFNSSISNRRALSIRRFGPALNSPNSALLS